MNKEERHYALNFNPTSKTPTHPIIKKTPPNGVIGPIILIGIILNKSLQANKYNEPEKQTIPAKKNKADHFIHLLEIK